MQENRISGKFQFLKQSAAKSWLLLETYGELTLSIPISTDIVQMVLSIPLGNPLVKWKSLKMKKWKHYHSTKIVKRKRNLLNRCILIALSKRLNAFGMIQKRQNWGSYELNPKDVEGWVFLCLFLSSLTMKNEYAKIILKSLVHVTYYNCCISYIKRKSVAIRARVR